MGLIQTEFCEIEIYLGNGENIWADSDENKMPQSAYNTSQFKWKEAILKKRKPILRITEHTQNLQLNLNDTSFFICFLPAFYPGAKIDRLFLSPLILAVPLTMTLGLEFTNKTINQKWQYYKRARKKSML